MAITKGVWYQSGDPTNISKWAGRGVDTFIGPPTVSGVWNYATFMTNLASAGMKGLIMASDAAAANDITLRPDYSGYTAPSGDNVYDSFGGWLIEPDEPDLQVNMIGYPGSEDADASRDLWISRCSYLRGLVAGNIQYGNFVGNNVRWCYNGGAKDRSTIYGFSWTHFRAMTNPLDLVSQDYYPLTVGDPIINLVEWTRAIVALAADESKPWGVYIECADQCLREEGRGPTAAEFRGEVWLALILGATGIYYFPQRVGTWRPLAEGGTADDNTTAEVAAEMAIQNALIEQEEGILTAVGSEEVALASPFFRRSCPVGDGSTRLYTLNFSDSQQTLDGVVYDPFEVKIETPLVAGSLSPGSPGATSIPITWTNSVGGSGAVATSRQVRRSLGGA
jgi:hypothetical protein